MLNDVVLRPIRESDVPDIQTVARKAWHNIYRTIFDPEFIESFVNRNYAPEAILRSFSGMEAGSVFFYVAEYASKVIGFCHIGIHREGAELYRIYLLPEFVGRGIGRGLLERGEAFLIEHGLYSCSLFVHKNNELGKRFYLSCGFKHIAERDKEDEWFMEKRLSRM